MKSKKNIVFLGMMGSGKTSIGKLTSKKLKLDFYDIDELIENKLKKKISEIFALKGEKFFRTIEEKITLKILKQKQKVVVSLGGGAFLNKNIQKEILNNHISFWLYCDEKTLIQRIRNSQKRPIAYNLTNHELTNLIKKRSNIYSKALYKIDCNKHTKIKITNKIINYL